MEYHKIGEDGGIQLGKERNGVKSKTERSCTPFKWEQLH